MHLDTDFEGDADTACALAMLLGWTSAELVGLPALLLRNAREHGEQPAPITFLVEDRTHLVSALAVAVEPAVLQLDARCVISFGNETDLDLGFEIGVVLPVGVDVPGEHEPGRRLP